MFSRAIPTQNQQSKDLNISSSEFFDNLSTKNLENLENFFSDPNLKPWQFRDENNYTALHRTVFSNDIQLTTFILESLKKRLGFGGSNTLEKFVNEKTNEGMTALHYAVCNGNIQMVKLLKNYGATFELITNLGKNAMHMAAENNQPSMMIYLLYNEGQDIFSVDENGSTPLHWACYSGAEESINFLISLKADINAQDKEKFTPLHLSVLANKPKIVENLLRKGADKNIMNNKNELPKDIAKRNHYVKISYLLENKDYNPLCTLEAPTEQIKSSNFYKKIIILMIVIPEIIIFILILPFIENVLNTFINFAVFLFTLIFYFMLLIKEPGYCKNEELLREGGNILKVLVERGENLKEFCPDCCVRNDENIKHCIICNKCVFKLSHHCFWINKCIGKKNLVIYLIFLFFAYNYAFHSLFICIYLCFDTVNIPYKKDFPPVWFNIGMDRGPRVLGAALVGLFSFFVSFPLFFLFMIELFKSCGLLGKKYNKENSNNNKINNINDLEIKDNGEERLIDNNEGDGMRNDINIPREEFPIADDRPSSNAIN